MTIALTEDSRPPVVTRRCSADQWQQLREVRLAALAEAPAAFGSSLEAEQSLSESAWRARIERAAVFLAIRGTEHVGMAKVQESGTGALIMGVWVAPEARGQGVVEALIAACGDAARADGASTVGLWVMEDNERAVRAYERLGFRDDGGRARQDDGRIKLFLTTPLR